MRNASQNNAGGMSECLIVSFDIDDCLDIPTAVVGKQNSNGFYLVNVIQGDPAIDLYEFLRGQS